MNPRSSTGPTSCALPVAATPVLWSSTAGEDGDACRAPLRQYLQRPFELLRIVACDSRPNNAQEPVIAAQCYWRWTTTDPLYNDRKNLAAVTCPREPRWRQCMVPPGSPSGTKRTARDGDHLLREAGSRVLPELRQGRRVGQASAYVLWRLCPHTICAIAAPIERRRRDIDRWPRN